MRKLTTRKQMFQYAVIAVVLGCSAPVAATDLEAVQKELNAQRQQWQLIESDEYVFQFERYCFCGSDFITPGLVHVVNGEIESVRHTETNELLDPTFYLTVDGLFDEVQLAIDYAADELLVEYNVPLGYPASIDIDFIERAIDDELSFRAIDLRMIPEPQSLVLMILGLVLWRSPMPNEAAQGHVGRDLKNW